MVAYALRRLVGAIPVLLVSTFIMFSIVASIRDPLAELRINCPNCDDSAYDRLTELYDLDQPIPLRFVSWLGGVVTGDLGTSTSLGEKPVSDVFWSRAWNTLQMAIPAAILVVVISGLLSMFSALRQYSAGDYVVTSFTYLGLAMPTFFFGLLLQVFWGVWWQDWTGTKPFWTSGIHNESIGQWLSSVTLPVITLIIISVASDTRFGRTAVLEARNADFIRTARAKGVPERTIVFKHLLRAALIPMVTVWAITFGTLLGGAVVTESIFAWPGIGRLLISGVFEGDVHLVMAAVLFIGTMAILFNLLADLAYGWLDPRVRYE